MVTPSSAKHPITRVADVAAAYDGWASVYDGDGNPLVALDDVVTPRLYRAHVSGRAVLDAGCGTGRHLVKLAQAGARCTGVDASRGMLDVAAQKVPSAELLQRDFVRDGLPCADDAFDVVVCTLVLEHVEDLRAPMRELARVTRPGGSVVVSDIHAAMRARTQANFTNPATGVDVHMPSFLHTVHDYVVAGAAAGLRVDVVVEHDGTPALVERTARARKYLGTPMLVALRFAKDGA